MKTKHALRSLLPIALVVGLSFSFTGITSSDTATALKCTACRWYVPNAFSPNNDGVNDIFRPYLGEECAISDYTLRIFNRWGTMVFESASPETGWDGRFRNQPAPQGVYLYSILYVDAASGSNALQAQNGEITLIR